jgi:hypothetical protein
VNFRGDVGPRSAGQALSDGSSRRRLDGFPAMRGRERQGDQPVRAARRAQDQARDGATRSSSRSVRQRAGRGDWRDQSQ